MPKKCECCRFFVEGTSFEESYCKNAEMAWNAGRFKQLIIRWAREICDREGDGHFVYFEPKDPSAGAACFVQITREPAKAIAAGA